MFSGQDPQHPACDLCGGIHQRACPRVKRLHQILNPENGSVIESDAEFWEPGGPWERSVIFPEDVWEPDDPGAGDADADQGAEHAAGRQELAADSADPAAAVTAGGEEAG